MKKIVFFCVLCIMLCTTAHATFTIKDSKGIVTSERSRSFLYEVDVTSCGFCCKDDSGHPRFQSNADRTWSHYYYGFNSSGNIGALNGYILSPAIVSYYTCTITDLGLHTYAPGYAHHGYSHGAPLIKHTASGFKRSGILSELTLNNCIVTGASISAPCPVTINGGNYSGNPAISSTSVTVTRGTLTDTGGSSQFLIGPDSESTVVKEGSTTITTVKLSNPPVIIDWADFPG